MKYFLLSAKDQRRQAFVLFEFRDRLTLREQYAPLRCPFCRKINENLALEQGIHSSVRVPSKDDFVRSGDGFIFFSRRLLRFLEAAEVGGFKHYFLPGDPDYVIATPSCLVPTDRQKMAIRVHRGLCPDCGRPKETTLLPTLSSLTLPPQRLILFASEVWAENSRGRVTWFTTTQEVVEIMEKNSVTGVEFIKPF